MFEFKSGFSWGPFSFEGQYSSEETRNQKQEEFAKENFVQYVEAIGRDRYGDAMDMIILSNDIRSYFFDKDMKMKRDKMDEIDIILELMKKVKTNKRDSIHPCEVEAIFNFRVLEKKLRNAKDGNEN